jgi:hypothetical protein
LVLSRLEECEWIDEGNDEPRPVFFLQIFLGQYELQTFPSQFLFPLGLQVDLSKELERVDLE